MFGFKVDRRPTLRSIPTPARVRRRPKKRDPFAGGGVEPSLEDLLCDPVTEAIMRCDGVNSATLRSLIIATREGLRSR